MNRFPLLAVLVLAACGGGDSLNHDDLAVSPDLAASHDFGQSPDLAREDSGPPTACTAGTTQCLGNGRQTCGVDGTWGTAVPCVDQTCVSGACTGTCVAGSSRCSSSTAMETCDATGTFGAATACESGNFCSGNACATASCTGIPVLGTFFVPVGQNAPSSIAVGDLNGDGFADFVNTNNTDFQVVLATGADQWSQPANYGMGSFTAVALGDLDGNGSLDLVASSFAADAAVYLNDGKGNFGTPTSHGPGGYINGLVLVDLDHDTHLDIVTANYNGSVLDVYLNQGTGTFPTTPSHSYVIGTNIWDVAAGTFNADIYPDLVVTDYRGGVNVLLNDGSGGFAAPVVYSGPAAPRRVVTGDFNGDTHIDLAVTDYSTTAQVDLYFGTGTGTFGTATKVNVGSTYAEPIVAVDLNHDGALDLVVGNATATVPLLNNKQGVFTPGQGIADPASSLATIDRRQDGMPDLVLLSPLGHVQVAVNDGSGLLTHDLGTSIGTLASFQSSGGPNSIVAVDLDGNGTLDLVAADGASMGSVSATLGLGNGMFANKVDTAVANDPRGIISADINGDGKPDILVANAGSNSVSVLLGNGTASFPSSFSLGTGTSPSGVTVGDFNGDGKLDIAAADSGSNDVSVLLNLGGATFATAVKYAVGQAPVAVASADLNGDGAKDLVVANSGSSSVSVLLGTGTGTFGTAKLYPVGNTPSAIVAVDLNGDGVMDMATADHGGKDVSVLLSTGLGGFASVAYALGSPPNAIVMTDVNGDGKVDLATSNDDGSVSLLLGYSGAFAAPFTYGAGTQPSGIASGDFDKDGKLDLVVANTSLAAAFVLLQRGCL